MSSMRDRQEGFEKKFAMDEESKFKAMARRNKLLGLWAAEKLGKTGADADAYAKEVVRADFEEAGDNDVFRKVRADFDQLRKGWRNVGSARDRIERRVVDIVAGIHATHNMVRTGISEPAAKALAASAIEAGAIDT